MATEGSLLDQVTDLFVALDGETVSNNVSVPPIERVVLDLFRVTPATGTLFGVTVTEQVAVLLLSTVVTVIVAVPTATAVTTPFVTVATEGSLLDQVTDLFVALDGETVSNNVSVPPIGRVVLDLLRVTPVTGMLFGVTVTEQVAVLPPLTVATVIVAVPAATAVTTPLFIVATEGSLLDQLTDLFVALDGEIVSNNISVPPIERVMLDLFRITPVTGMVFGVTVTEQVAVLPPSTVATVIVAVPAATAITTPFVTVATEGLLLDQVTSLLVASDGSIVAINVSVLPSISVAADLFRVTPVTERLTATAQVAVLLPSTVVTVIVDVPGETAVTRPLLFTVATEGSLLDQVTFLLVALDG